MPRTDRGANGNGAIRKITTSKNGKTYTYWQARYTEGYDPGTGKQVQRSITGKTQKDVAKKLKEATLAIDHGTYTAPCRLTVREWMDIWTADYMNDKKYLTVKNYKALIEHHIKPELGAIRISDLAPHMIQQFYNRLLKSGCAVPKRDKAGKIVKKNGKTVLEPAPMCAKSVRNVHGVLSKALSVAVNIGYLHANPTERVTLPRVEKKELRPLTDEQVSLFLKEASSDSYEIILKVILFTGLRESEAIGLTWDCIDFKNRSVKICKQLQKRPLRDGGTTFASLKNDKTRILKPAPFVMGLLERQYREQSMQKRIAGSAWKSW